MGSRQDEILETRLPATVNAPSLARHLVRSAGLELSGPRLNDAQLLVSELVTGVQAYAGQPRPIHLRIRTSHVLSVEVEEIPEGIPEDATVAPASSDPPGDGVQGPHPAVWGRDLIATLADAWGVSRRNGRSSAWVELRLDR
jgi:anti-sigma regulatory factor (Ser/Thr protein kinase)